MTFSVDNVEQKAIKGFLRFPPIHAASGEMLLKRLSVDLSGYSSGMVEPDVWSPFNDRPGDYSTGPYIPPPEYNFGWWNAGGGGWDGTLDDIYAEHWARISTIEPVDTDEGISFFDGGADLSGSVKWRGGVLALNGCIYGIPNGSRKVLKINPMDDSVRLLNIVPVGLERYGWLGGVLAPNGKIYCTPNGANQILVIDPSDDSAYVTGDLSTYRDEGWSWAGANLGMDGKIYCPPLTAVTTADILVISPGYDPLPDIVGLVGLSDHQYPTYYAGATCPNGRIVMPHDSSWKMYLSILPPTTVVYGPGGGGGARWKGAVMCPNGNVQFIPYKEDNADFILYTNAGGGYATSGPSLPSVSWSTGGGRCDGGILAPNGKIYGIPSEYDRILRITPSTTPGSPPSVSTIGSVPTGSFKWSGGVLGPNGHIYCIPCNSTAVLKISGVGEMNETTSALLHPFFNKL